ncbi:hypothetical protein HPO96_17790 [Kribbella sandramycini]|uniref:Uncharacterized protein n=1 Tax=Kribbella sandramycini TaxID=60450 RepID=A0A7Y4L0J4_9ACTN|nr:hypothetical protein [Kribbella sandramycini]MBB6565836.1 hypothetical protein [Kribbella sandramycini]NOL42100.1 hypothetical protein [Kribbella sandramycini]
MIAVSVGTALLVVGCGGEPEATNPAPKPSPTSSAPAPVDTPTTAPPPPPSSAPTTPELTAVGYRNALGHVDGNLARGVARVMNAPTLAAFDSARAQLAGAVAQQRGELAKVNGPKSLGSGHTRVLAAFDAFPSSVTTNLAESGETKTGCGLPKAAVVRLYQAKSGIRTSVVQLAQAVNKSVGKGSNFGTRMTPPALKPPAVLTGRGQNGQIIQRAGARGAGSLQINNNGSVDVVVVVAPGVPRKPQASIYVRRNSNATLRGIRGSYWVYFKSGESWDSASRQFTEGCSFSKYDDRFDGKYDWRVTLSPVIGGNASTSNVDPF